MSNKINKDVIIACDFSSAEQCYAFLDKFKDEARKPFLKIGMELFYAAGPEIIKELKRQGFKIFLDLKLHKPPMERAPMWSPPTSSTTRLPSSRSMGFTPPTKVGASMNCS